MPVVIDQKLISADDLGLETVGAVLAHVQRDNRLVVHLLIDGEEPDLATLPQLRLKPTLGHTIFVETTEPQTMAAEVLDAVESHIREAESLSREAVDFLQAGDAARAFQKLSGCFGRWTNIQESVRKVAQLLRVDLDRLEVGGQSLSEFFQSFGEQLRSIRDALEGRDFVALADVLNYELPPSSQTWCDTLVALRKTMR